MQRVREEGKHKDKTLNIEKQIIKLDKIIIEGNTTIECLRNLKT